MIECSRHNRAAVREAKQDNVAQVLVEHDVHDILHMRYQADLGIHQVDAFTDPRQARREHLMAARLQHAANMTEPVRTVQPPWTKTYTAACPFCIRTGCPIET